MMTMSAPNIASTTLLVGRIGVKPAKIRKVASPVSSASVTSAGPNRASSRFSRGAP